MRRRSDIREYKRNREVFRPARGNPSREAQISDFWEGLSKRPLCATEKPNPREEQMSQSSIWSKIFFSLILFFSAYSIQAEDTGKASSTETDKGGIFGSEYEKSVECIETVIGRFLSRRYDYPSFNGMRSVGEISDHTPMLWVDFFSPERTYHCEGVGYFDAILVPVLSRNFEGHGLEEKNLELAINYGYPLSVNPDETWFGLYRLLTDVKGNYAIVSYKLGDQEALTLSEKADESPWVYGKVPLRSEASDDDSSVSRVVLNGFYLTVVARKNSPKQLQRYFFQASVIPNE